jgi:hypothetical protein
MKKIVEKGFEDSFSEVLYDEANLISFDTQPTVLYYDEPLNAQRTPHNSRLSKSFRERQRARERLRHIESNVWPDDLQPSKDTIERSNYFWQRVQNVINGFNIKSPIITVADDNSIDFFWGDNKERVLINVPSSSREPIILNYIDSIGQTTIKFTDSHVFNVYNIIRELKHGID